MVVDAVHARKTFDKEDWLVLVTPIMAQGDGHGGGHNVAEIRNSFVIVSGPDAKRGPLDEATYLVDVPVHGADVPGRHDRFRPGISMDARSASKTFPAQPAK